MKIDRLIGIIMILLQHEKVTAPQLAERFEVSRRTINRDIETICQAGIPLVTTQGYDGGISISEGYKINKMFFTEEELQMVLVGLKGVDSVSKISYFTTFVEKLSSMDSRPTVEDVIIIDLATHDEAPLTQKIAEIKQAILTRHHISFCYYYQKGESYRQIEPYRLIFKWSAWYVFGYCLDRQAYRLFKLNRLGGLKTQDTIFSPRVIPDEALNVEGYFAKGRIHLQALFDVSEKHRLIEEYGVECYRLHGEGRLFFEWDFVSYENMREWIFSFGDKVEVLAPAELIEDRIKQAQHIIDQK